MVDFEKLGVFYLGKEYDLEHSTVAENLVLYDSKDLTTHALIIGMTGSGKTGLGLGLIEEAAIDGIPVIAIDPKGDLGNLLLTFPDLAPGDFQRWANPHEAANTGVSIEEYAAAQAASWQTGLADWGQSGERIRKLRETVDLAIYTPGSSAGIPISVLRSFDAPPAQIRDDIDLYNERIQATATSVLTLMGIDADPLSSPEHVLIANILSHVWASGESLDMAGLIRAILKPPFATIGVFDVESFYPTKDRSALAMKLNNLLASPGFAAWMTGEPLDASRLLYSDTGKPKVSIISIAHLSDQERMFFVTMLLNAVTSWMRAQAGTSSLRAILYMDEIYGYVPPTANPPSKTLILTLLKQARAFGLGVVLATQNPVDLDYKGLANIGTWFIGRLQTERDKARVMEGLEGATAGGTFDKAATERILASLGKRVFYLHSVHEAAPTIFTTRWTLSYLAGPLTRDQIRQLTANRPAVAANPRAAAKAATLAPAAPAASPNDGAQVMLPQGIKQFFLPPTKAPAAGTALRYQPVLLGAADIAYNSTRYAVQSQRRGLWSCEFSDGVIPIDWPQATELDRSPDDLDATPIAGTPFGPLPAAAANTKSYAEWSKLFTRWLQTSQQLTLYRSPTTKLVSQLDESERDFRIRLQQAMREERDSKVDALRKRYATKLATMDGKLRKAQQVVRREQDQAGQRRMDAAMSLGGGLLGAMLGRRKSSMRTVMRNVGKIHSGSDVAQAQETLQVIGAQRRQLEAELQAEIEEIAAATDVQNEELETVAIAPKSTAISVHFVGLGWIAEAP